MCGFRVIHVFVNIPVKMASKWSFEDHECEKGNWRVCYCGNITIKSEERNILRIFIALPLLPSPKERTAETWDRATRWIWVVAINWLKKKWELSNYRNQARSSLLRRIETDENSFFFLAELWAPLDQLFHPDLRHQVVGWWWAISASEFQSNSWDKRLEPGVKLPYHRLNI